MLICFSTVLTFSAFSQNSVKSYVHLHQVHPILQATLPARMLNQGAYLLPQKTGLTIFQMHHKFFPMSEPKGCFSYLLCLPMPSVTSQSAVQACTWKFYVCCIILLPALVYTPLFASRLHLSSICTSYSLYP